MKERRTRIVSHRRIQFALVKRILLHWAILFVASLSLMTVWQLLVSGEPFNLFSEHMKTMWIRIAPVFVVLAVLLPVFVYDTIKFSNQMTGPIYRLQKSLQSLANGEELGPIKFRKKDFWQDLATDFNNLLESTDHGVKQDSDNESCESEEAQPETV